MSEPLRILHGAFGRVALLLLDKTMVVHAHRVCHVIFKVGGPDILFGVRERQHPVSDKNAVLVNAWEPHFYEHKHGAPSTVLLALYLEPQWLKDVDKRFVYSIHPHFFSEPSVLLQGRLSQLRADLLDLLTAREGSSLRDVEDIIVRMITELTCEVTRWNELSSSQLIGGIAYDGRIRQSLEAMRHLGGVDLDFDAIAQSVGLSRPHFFHLFRKQTGMTPVTFSSMLRMESSIRSVARAEMPLHDIALNLGFDSPGNFTRFFACQQGVTPSQYRRMVEFMPGTHA
jgi:AraC family transcriptional regulator